MERILELAIKRADAAEVFRIDRSQHPILFQNGKLATSEREDMWGVALRIIKDGKIGFSTTTSLGDTEGVVARAISASKYGPEAEIEFQSNSSESINESIYDPDIMDLSISEMIGQGQKMMSIVLDSFPEISINGDISKSIDDIRIINSSGGDVKFRKSMHQAFIEILLTLEGDRAELEHGWSSTSLGEGYLKLANDAVWRFRNCSRVASIETGRMPVIFTSLAFRGLYVPLFQALNGLNIHKETSILSGKLGESVVDSCFTLVDDPHARGLPGSTPFDDEGTPTMRKSLISKGILEGFFYNLKTAGKAGVESTGNGFKKSSLYTGFSVDSQPGAWPSNFVISPGDKTIPEMIKGIKQGIIVDDVIGAGQGNNMAGAYAMNVALGYKIENGEIVGRLKDVMIAGNVMESLSNISEMSEEVFDEDCLFGRYSTPWISVNDCSVSAT